MEIFSRYIILYHGKILHLSTLFGFIKYDCEVMMKLKPSEVFKTQGQPTITYVQREDGKYEKRLSDSLDSGGTICLLTGPSKTGKTTLYTEVLIKKKMEPLVVRCHSELRAQDAWRIALEKVNFQRIRESSSTKEKTKSLEGKIGGRIGWPWLAGLIGEVKTGISAKDNDAIIREKILADPEPAHLVPILKNLPYILVVEDFHYLKKNVQKTIFQQWKAFVDNEVSVIVVGTTHHAADLAYSNRDLIGRYTQIDLSSWLIEDLVRIPTLGYDYLEINIEESKLKIIARESVGLPLITQSVSLQLILDAKQNLTDKNNKSIITKTHVFEALYNVASMKFSAFSAIHDRLIRGPRSKRKYNTYELVLSTFAQDPLMFSLTREDINVRLKNLSGLGIHESVIPPTGSVTSMLNAIGSFQRKLQLELLEWSDNDQRLYILEPTFLFYLRWKERRTTFPKLQELINEIAKKLTENIKITLKL